MQHEARPPSGRRRRERDEDDLTFWNFIDYVQQVAPDRWPGIDLEAVEVFMSLRRTVDLIFYDLHRQVNDLGISVPGLGILLVLDIAGPLELNRLAYLTGGSKAACSKAVRTLEREGLVGRSKDADDQRKWLIELQPEGRKIFHAAHLRFNARERVWVDKITAEERAELVRILARLREFGTNDSVNLRGDYWV